MFKKRMLFGEEISAAVLSGDNMRLQVSGTFYKVPNGAETSLQNGNTIIERCEDGSLVITTEHLIPFTTNDDQIVEMADKILVDTNPCFMFLTTNTTLMRTSKMGLSLPSVNPFAISLPMPGRSSGLTFLQNSVFLGSRQPMKKQDNVPAP